MTERIAITEEDSKDLIESWMKEASSQTAETVGGFISRLLNDYSHDYGTICHAAVAAALAGAYAVNSDKAQGGITGFQGSCIMWEFIKRWQGLENSVGLKLINYDRMLYPQYAIHFRNTVSKECFAQLKEKAAKLIEEKKDNHVHPDVLTHWLSITHGQVPFGLEVVND